MGLFDKFLGREEKKSKEPEVKVPWHLLNSLKQLDEIEEESYKTKIAIFKHSTRCGISKMVLRKFEREHNPEIGENVKLYFLDLLLNREVSAEIAQRFDVRHESPQLIVLKDGKVVFDASHQAIEIQAVNSLIA